MLRLYKNREYKAGSFHASTGKCSSTGKSTCKNPGRSAWVTFREIKNRRRWLLHIGQHCSDPDMDVGGYRAKPVKTWHTTRILQDVLTWCVFVASQNVPGAARSGAQNKRPACAPSAIFAAQGRAPEEPRHRRGAACKICCAKICRGYSLGYEPEAIR